MHIPLSATQPHEADNLCLIGGGAPADDVGADRRTTTTMSANVFLPRLSRFARHLSTSRHTMSYPSLNHTMFRTKDAKVCIAKL